MPKKKKLPTTIYVNRENPGTEDEFLNVNLDAADSITAEAISEVGEYELVKVWKGQLRPHWEK